MAVNASRGFSLLEMMFVVLIAMTVTAIAIPMSGNILGYFRLSGDARAVSNAVAVTKMRAASDFTRARLYFDLAAKTHHMETYVKTGTPGWAVRGGTTSLSQGVTPGFLALAIPPPNTQAAIGQAAPCLDNANAVIANTACLIFNSRGVPVDTTGAPTADDAVYLTDGTGVYSITAAASGMIQLWRSGPSVAAWVRQ
jgi:Tfp pilus assembly protein FimT